MEIKVKNIYYASLYILLNSICFSQLMSLNALSVLIAFAIVILSLLFPYKEAGVYLYSCLPFFNVINGHMGSTSMYYLIVGVVLLKYLYYEKRKNLTNKLLIFMLFLIVTVGNITAGSDYLQWIIRIIPLIFLMDESIIVDKLPKIIRFYSLSMIIASAWGWLMMQSGSYLYSKGYVYLSSSASTTRFAGLVGDAVIYGGQNIILIALLLIMLYKDKSHKIFNMICVVGLVLFGAMTYSKNFFLCLIIEIILYYFYWNKYRKKDYTFIFMSIATIVCIAACVGVFIHLLLTSNSSFFVSLRTRFTVNDLTTGRTDIWIYYINWLKNNNLSLIKGMPLSEYKIKRTIGIHTVSYTHNVFLETMVVFGILEAVSLFVWLIVWTMKTYNNRKDILYFFPLIMVLIIGATVHGHFEYSYYLNLLLILSSTKWLYKTNEDLADKIKKRNTT